MIGAYANRGGTHSKKEICVIAFALFYIIFAVPLLIIWNTPTSWGLAVIPTGFLLYSGYKKGRKKRAIVNNILEQIKTECHNAFDPDPSYEHKSISSLYFGIDIKKGTALYIRLYPNKTLDVIGIDIDNFTRTVVRENCMEIHTKYVNMPMLELSIGVNSARSIANTLHAMAERGYDYSVDFPRLIQAKRKEWEQIAGMPVAEVF